MTGTTIAALEIAGDPARWRDLGFLVDDNGCCRLGATTLQLGGSGMGILSWTLRGSRRDGPVDGLPTVHRGESAGPAAPAPTHPNTACSVDHLVVRTPDFERTLEAIDAIGMRLRRTRDTPSGMRQGFFRHGETILEVVGPSEPPKGPGPAGPASFWGLVATVGDIDAAAQLAGPRLGQMKDAVQPARRIATVAREAGLSVRMAFISN